MYKICHKCGKRESKNLKMVRIENDYFLCTKCFNKCIEDNKTLLSDDKMPIVKKDFLFPTPHQIYDYLNDYIIGQDDAKKKISIAIYNHYKRINNKKYDIEKSNLLITGPTGTGKTELARCIAKILEVPFVMADATAFTEAGYVGDDVENVLLRLYQASDYDLEMTQRGIVYIDEIDKISRKSSGNSGSRDVSGEGVQQSLLKMVEGTKVSITLEGNRKNSRGENITIDTNNILFIVAGAFDGLDDIKNESNKKIGFNSAFSEKTDIIIQKSLVKYGLIPELISRFPVIVSTNKLSEEDLIRILKEPKNSLIEQYKNLLKLDGIKLNFSDKALEKVAKRAYNNECGARGLKSVMEEIMEDIMFNAPDSNKKTINITEKDIEGVEDAK